MKYLTIEHIRQHLRIDPLAEEDAVLDLYGGAAEDTVLSLCNRTIDDVIATYGCVPDALRQATLLLVGMSYQIREPATAQHLSSVPYGSVDILLKPYMRLADWRDTSRQQMRTVVLGSDAKIEFRTDLPDNLTLQDVDFTVTVYNETAVDRKVTCPKNECIPTDKGTYIVLIDTDALGVGLLMLRVVIRIPDTDYPTGYRKEVVKINPYVRVTG